MADTLSSIHRFIIQNIRLHGKYCKYSQSVNYIKKAQNARQHSCLLLKKKTHVVYEELNHFPSSCCQEYRWFLFFCCWRSGLVLVLISFCTAAPSWCWLSLNFSSSPSPSASNIFVRSPHKQNNFLSTTNSVYIGIRCILQFLKQHCMQEHKILNSL